MSNLSLMTAIQCSAGNQRYYLGAMSVAQLVREVVVDDDFPTPAPPSMRSANSAVEWGSVNRYPLYFLVGAHASSVRFTPFELPETSPLYAGLSHGVGILTLDAVDGLVALSKRPILLALKRWLQDGTVAANDQYGVQIVPLEKLAPSLNRRTVQSGDRCAKAAPLQRNAE